MLPFGSLAMWNELLEFVWCEVGQLQFPFHVILHWLHYHVLALQIMNKSRASPPPRRRSKAYQEAKTLELPGGTHAGALPLNPARGAYGSPRTPSCRTLHSLCSLHSVFLPFLNSLCHPCFLHPPHESFKVIWTSSFEIHTSPVEDFWKVFYRGSSIFKWISLSSNSIWNLQW